MTATFISRVYFGFFALTFLLSAPAWAAKDFNVKNDTDTFLFVNGASGNVGIGTTTPQAAFAVANKNVGIGTWTASSALDVNGTVTMTGFKLTTSPTNGYVMTSDANGNGTWQASSGTISGLTAGYISKASASTSINDSSLFQAGNNIGLGTTTPQTSFAVASGNVGIGTWTAAQALDVVGSIAATGAIAATGNITGANMTGAANPSASIGMSANNGAATTFMRSDATPAISAAIAPTWTGIHTFTNATASALFTGGNVGIGTTTPQTAFAVAAGNVGIGTWVASGALDVRGGNVRIGSGTNSNATAAGDLYVGGNLEVDGSVWLGDAAADNLTVVGAFNQTGNINTTANVGVGTTTPQASIAVASGNVGIGTWTAAQALDVVGNIAATGAIAATGNITGANMTGAANPSASIGMSANNGTATTFMRSDATPAISAAIAPTWTGNHIFAPTSGDTVFTAGNVGIGTTTPQGELIIPSGNLGIGTWVPSATLDIHGGSFKISKDGGNGSVSMYNAGGYFNYVFYRSGGTVKNPSVVASTNILGTFDFEGHGGTDYEQGAYISAQLDGTPGNNDMPTALVFATTADGASGSTERLRISNAGNIGIGTSTPQAAVAIANRNVGIGTWTATAALDVIGTVKSTGFQLNNSPTAGYVLISGSTGIGTWMAPADIGAGGGSGTVNTGAAGAFTYYPSAGTTVDDQAVLYSDGTNIGIGTTTPQAAFAIANRNVGIGTWTAAQALDVVGSIAATGTIAATGNVTGANMTGGANPSASIGLSANNGTATTFMRSDGTPALSQAIAPTWTGNHIFAPTAGNTVVTAGNVGIGTSTPQAAFVVTNGNVGIGTWAPAKALDIVGTGTVTDYIRLNDGSGVYQMGIGFNSTQSSGYVFMNSAHHLRFGTNNIERMRIESGGNVGIGTTTPQTAFAVAAGNVGIGTWVASGALDVRGGNVRIGSGTNSNATAAGDLYVGGNLEVDGSVWLGDAAADNLTVVGSFNQTGDINTTANVGVGTTTPQASIAVASGNVGIGTWTAAQALDVNGSIAATGAIAATGNITGANMTGGANPSASIGMSANNGAATTFMRSDATPAISAAIAPTWTGIHTFTNATASALFTGGNVGIGTTTPQAAVAIVNRNVGIGTWTATAALDVIGTVKSTGFQLNNSPTAGYVLISGSTGIGTWMAPADIGAGGGSGTVNTGAAGAFSYYPSAGTTVDDQAVLYSDGTNIGIGTTTPQAAFAIANRNVGIGTWTAAQALDVVGSIAATGTIAATGNITGANMTGAANPSASIGLAAANGTATTFMRSDATPALSQAIAPTWTGNHIFAPASGNTVFTAGNVGIGTTTPQGAFVVTNGNVGIGTWTASSPLAVSNGNPTGGILLNLINPGTANGAWIRLDASAATNPTEVWDYGSDSNGFSIYNTTDSAYRFIINNSGNIGIGTTTPQAAVAIVNRNVGIGTWTAAQALDVVGSIAATGAIAATGNITGANMTGAANPSASIGLSANNGTATTFMRSDGTPALSQAIAPTWTGNHIFAPTSGDTVFTAGNVGIGTTTPQAAVAIVNRNVGIGTWTATAALDVIGTVKSTGMQLDNSPSAGYVLVSGTTGIGTWMAPSSIGAGGGGSGTVNTGVAGAFSYYPSAGTTVDDQAVLYSDGTNIGIGTTTPQTALVIPSGNVGIGTWTSASNALTVFGNVGIGTVVSPQKVYVAGTLETQAFKMNNGAASSYVLTSNSVGVGTWMNAANLPAGSAGGGSPQLQYNSSGSFGGVSGSGVDSNGNVGLGTVTPQGKLVVLSGNVGIGTWAPTAQLEIAGSGNTYFLGNVGVGVESPTVALDVSGAVTATSTVTANALSVGAGALAVNSSGAITASTGIASSGAYTQSGTSANTFSGTSTFSHATTAALFSNGNVGIGTSTVPQKLYVAGTMETQAFKMNNGSTTGYVLVSGSTGIGTWMAPGTISSGGSPAGNNTTLQYNNNGAFGGATGVVFDGTNVGIGTAGPRAKLEISNNLAYSSVYDNGNSGTSKTIDWNNGNIQKISMTGNCVFTFTAPGSVSKMTLILTQDGTGSRTAAWPATVKWPSAVAPTLTTTATTGKDIVNCLYDGTSYYCSETLDLR